MVVGVAPPEGSLPVFCTELAEEGARAAASAKGLGESSPLAAPQLLAFASS